MNQVTRTEVEVDYPYSDGQPMAESDFQLVPMLYLLTALRTHFRDRQDVYVGGDMFVYYEEGNPAAVVTPDVFVVMGTAKHMRWSYKLWEEPKGPDFIMEIVSPCSWSVDWGEKRALYASLGVEEYWLHDPTGERMESRLRGLRLEGGSYREMTPAAVWGGRGLHSAVLGLDMKLERDGALRMHDPVTGEDLPTYQEAHDARLAEEARAKAAAAARLAAETRAKAAAEARLAAEARAKAAADARLLAETLAKAEAAACKAVEANRKVAEAGREATEADREAADASVAELESLIRTLRNQLSPPGG